MNKPHRIVGTRVLIAAANRLSRDGELLGPDYDGFNTGRRPKIIRCNGLYIVGPESSVDRLLPEIMTRAGVHVFKDRRSVKNSNLLVYALDSREPAVAKFIELCEQVAA